MRKYVSSTVNLRGLSICAVILLVSSVFAAAQHEQVLYSFGAGSGDGRLPSGTLIADATGNLYGAAEQGGASNAGTVFELSPSVPPGSNWTETILYTFSGGGDGLAPNGTLVFDSMGNLYGTTSSSGNPSCPLGGCGVVFQLSPPAVQGGSWTMSTLYSFGGGSDGHHPVAGLIFDLVGNLYGTTAFGGGVGSCQGSAGSGCGTVFELSPPSSPGGAWTEAVLYSFTGGDDGATPEAPVVIDPAGNLYGTAGGGNVECEFSACGVAFELTPSNGGPWTETVIHDFGSIRGDGIAPGPILLDKSGVLVGTTGGGGTYENGTVFGMLPPSKPGGQWTYGVLYSFGKSQTDGLGPAGGVIAVNGMLYGTTIEGGTSAAGTVFQLARAKGEIWKETGLYSFKGGADGARPEAGLFQDGGALYGTTSGGGNSDDGTVFRVFK
jgi:uncharacterized repeat protein (TIGR03803 family)